MPLPATAATICSRSVDLPIPGSPPISTALPATSPPPSTRSSSPMPEELRAASCVSASSATHSIFLPLPEVSPLGVASMDSSTLLFQLLQASHLPDHSGWMDSQDWQTKEEVDLAIGDTIEVWAELSSQHMDLIGG